MNSVLTILLQSSAFSTKAVTPCKTVLKERQGVAFLGKKHAVKVLHICRRLCTLAVPDQNILETGSLRILFEMQIMQLSSHGGFVLPSL